MDNDPKAPGHAFLSYVRQDSSEVDRIQRVLQAAGISVWRDDTDLQPGDDWRTRIRHAITRDALAFIACFSKASASRATTFQREELTLAIEQLRLRNPDAPWLFPVRLDDCLIPDLDIGRGRTLADIQHADLFGDHYDEGVARLVAAVLRILGDRPSAAVPPAANAESPEGSIALPSDLAKTGATLEPSSPPLPDQKEIRTARRRASRRRWATIAMSTAVAAALVVDSLFAAGVFMFSPQVTRAMGAISGIAFNPSGKVLAAASRDGFTYLRRLTSGGTSDAGTTYDTPPNSLGVNSVAFSPDGSLLASGDDNGDVYLWRWKLPYKPHSLLPNPGCAGVDGVAFSQKGQLLAVGCESGLVYLWQFPSQHRIRPALRSAPGITSIAFSPQGNLLATGNDNGHIYLWNTTGRKQITDLPASGSSGGVYGVAFSDNGSLVAAACRNGSVYLWRVTRDHFKKLPQLTAPASTYGLTSVAFSPVSNLLAAGDANGSVDIWNIASRTRTIRVDTGGGGVLAVAFSPDGTLVGAGDDLGRVRTWRLTV